MPEDYRAGRPGVYRIKQVRQLRTESTDAERKLWGIIRDRQVAGLKFRRQHQFGQYVLDFYCAEHHLAIEADGGQHTEDDAIAHDEARGRFLTSHGIRVLRFFNNDILANPEGVAVRIVEAIDRQPHPSPLPEGEGTERKEPRESEHAL